MSRKSGKSKQDDDKEGRGSNRYGDISSFCELGELIEDPPSRAFEKELKREESERSSSRSNVEDNLAPASPKKTRKSKNKKKIIPRTYLQVSKAAAAADSDVPPPSISGRQVPTTGSNLPSLGAEQIDTTPRRSYIMSVNMTGCVVQQNNVPGGGASAVVPIINEKSNYDDDSEDGIATKEMTTTQAPRPSRPPPRPSITTEDAFQDIKNKRTGSSGELTEKGQRSSFSGRSRNSFAGLDLEASTELIMEQAVAAAKLADDSLVDEEEEGEDDPFVDRSQPLTQIHRDNEERKSQRSSHKQEKESRPKYHNHPLMPFDNSKDDFDFAGESEVTDPSGDVEDPNGKKPSSYSTRNTTGSGRGIPASVTASMTGGGTVGSNGNSHQQRPRRESEYKPRRRHYESQEERAKRHQRLMTIIGLTIVILLIGVIAMMFFIGTKTWKQNFVGDDQGKNNNNNKGPSILDGLTPISSPTESPTKSPVQTLLTDLDPNSMLAIITEQRGFLRCGIPTEKPGFSVYDNIEHDFVGFDVDLCRAVAAALFGTSQDRVQFRTVTASDRFSVLQSGEIDILARTTTHTMERQVVEPTTQSGFSFSIPYLYNGLYFAGDPFFVECADAGNSTDACAQMSICALGGTTHVDAIRSGFESVPLIIEARTTSEMYTQFINGACDVVAGEQFDVAPSILHNMGHSKVYVMGNVSHSKEPLALVTRNDDAQWSDFVNWVVQGLIASEENGVTQERSWTLSQTGVFGRQFSNMFINAVREVGNYAEMYRKHLDSILPRPTANMLNVGISGVLYGMPFGNLQHGNVTISNLNMLGPLEGGQLEQIIDLLQHDNVTISNLNMLGPLEGGQLKQIIDRGYLRCGVSLRVIFAQNDEASGAWTGFDVDFCRAVSAAIFGRSDNIEFTSLSASERFFALESGDVDLLSRLTTVTLERDAFEPNVGTGFSFTQPNFYDGLTFGGIPPFVQCADSLDVISVTCRDLRICVIQDTTFESKLVDLFPGRLIVSKESWEEVYKAIDNDECNTIAGGVSDVSMTSVRGNGYNGVYQTGLNRYSKDPLAVVTRQRNEDTQWSTFVYWVVSALFHAEEQGITQDTAFEEMPEIPFFGPDLSNMLRNAVQEVGSYADIYNRNAEVEVSRGGLNLINFGLVGPQHYPLPGVNAV